MSKVTETFCYEAFQHAAQYLTGILFSADIFAEAVSVADKIFKADCAAVFRQNNNSLNRWSVHNAELIDGPGETVFTTVTEVFESGFLSIEQYSVANQRLQAGFFPVVQGSDCVAVLLIGYLDDDPMPKVLLDALLATSGMLGSLFSRQQADKNLKKLHQRYRMILESSGEGIFGLDTDGNHTFVNPAAAQMLGFEISELEGEHSHCKWHYKRADGSVYPETECPIYESLVKGQERQGEEYFVRKDGLLMPVEYVSTPILENDEIVGAVVNFRDITERKAAEMIKADYQEKLEQKVKERTAELETAKKAAETANRAKSVYLANMSHELRTPLNAILGFTQLMARDNTLKKEHVNNLGIVNRSGHYLLELINNVLEISRIEAGRITLELNDFVLKDMLKSVLDLISVNCNAKGLKLNSNFDPALPRYVRADETHLRQLLINLLNNAVKFTESGSIDLNVALTSEKNIFFSVCDTGCGIAQKELKKIFDPFYQTSAGYRQGEGTGLGLAITYEYVHMMGGTLKAESDPGKGTCFSFSIPLQEMKDINIQQKEDYSSITYLEEDQTTWRLLIVEDVDDSRELLRQLLESVGFEVFSAKNGQEGVDMFQRFAPHLIWMDIRMPVMDGMEATKKIRELPGGDQVKIIALTAATFGEERQEIYKAGCNALVHKPFKQQEIFDTLKQFLGVRYVYEDQVQETLHNKNQELDPRLIENLPEELQEKIKKAAITCDIEAMQKEINQVVDHSQQLADQLSRLSSSFRFDVILSALKTIQP